MFRRRSSETASVAVQDEPNPQQQPGQGGKGRPTPSRREAEQTRRRMRTVSNDPREQRRISREQRREAMQRGRIAMNTGDVKNMPVQHAGPVKAFVRDYLDSRWRFSEFAMGYMVLLLVLSVVARTPAALELFYLLWLVLLICVAVDWVLLMRGLRRELLARFSADEVRGYRLYALARVIQFRALRQPKPRVRRGQKP